MSFRSKLTTEATGREFPLSYAPTVMLQTSQPVDNKADLGLNTLEFITEARVRLLFTCLPGQFDPAKDVAERRVVEFMFSSIRRKLLALQAALYSGDDRRSYELLHEVLDETQL